MGGEAAACLKKREMSNRGKTPIAHAKKVEDRVFLGFFFQITVVEYVY